LRTRAKAVERIDDEVKAVARRMIELMHEAEGAGLAAPQVGLSWRMFATRGEPEDSPPQIYINPELTIANPELDVHDEGCLSLPDIRADIQRPRGITIRAIGLDGKSFAQTSDEFIARIWQHELDHLNGVLIIDKMTPMDRLATRKALKNLEAEAAARTNHDASRLRPGAVR
jgi:peptide deformylase